MKLHFRQIALFAFALLIAGCVSQTAKVGEFPAEPKARKITLLHQSNRWGSLDPCGCSVNPFGGIDREFNAIEAIKKLEGSTLFVDAGNMYVRRPVAGPISHYQGRAKALTEMLNELGLEAFAPGPNDYELGLAYLRTLEKEAKFKFISTNVVDASGKPVFNPFTVIEKEGVRYGVVSLTPPNEKLADNLKVVETDKALNEWLPKVHAASDVVILLSQLDSKTAQAVAEGNYGIPVIVGADAGVSSDQAFPYNKGRTLYVDAHVNGNLLGRLYLELQLPFTDFNQGHSVFSHELTKLDKERFGKPNHITKLIEKEKERTRKAALSE